MDAFFFDVRHAWRALLRAPVLSAVAILSIGLGAGANTTVFTWLNGLVLHPFPAIREPERVVGLEVKAPDGGGRPVSLPTFQQWRDQSRSFSGAAAWTISRVSVREAREQASVPLLAMPVSGSYFAVLGGSALLGRVIEEHDESSRSPVIVLAYSYWMRRYAGDRGVLGRTLSLNGASFTIIGIARARFVGTYVGVVPDMFVPITLVPRITGTNPLEDRNARVFQAVARLAPGIRPEQADAELDAVARRVSGEFGDRPVLGAKVMDIRTQYLGGVVQPLFLAMLAVTALLLVVGCANVASLLLVRASARRHELSLRFALGASRGRIVRLVIVESAIIAFGGGCAGAAIALAGRAAISQFIPAGPLPLSLDLPIDARVLSFAFGIACAVVLACGLAPALRSARVPPANALRSGGRSSSAGHTRVRDAIVAAQLAFSLLCLMTAGMFIRGLRAAAAVNIGFSGAEHVLLINTNLASARMNDTTGEAAIRAILDATRALPPVSSATVATMVPLALGGKETAEMKVQGYAAGVGEDVSAIRSSVGSAYATTMGIRLVRGRDITDEDRAGSAPVALVNETFARHYWPGRDALGRQIDAGRGWMTIVGVLGDGKYGSLTERPQAVVYVPIAQWYQPSFTIHIRAAGDPRTLTETVRRVLQRVHVDLPALQPRTLAEHAGASTFIQRTAAEVLSVFGIAALILSAIGLYGALVVTVALRSREIGIRMALGAGTWSVVWSVLGQALGIVGGGILAGVPLVAIASSLVRRRFVEAGAASAGGLATAAGLLGLAAMVAAAAPMRRAIRVDPARVLRDDI